MMKKKYTHVIWDFNGTILDDVALGIDSVNVMLRKRGLAVIPDVTYYRSIMRFPVIDYYRDLGFDFEKEDYYQILAPEWVALYLAGEASCPMMAGVAEQLARISAMGIPQMILSASDRNQLMGQLNRLGILSYFHEILGLDNIYAGSKTALAEAWRKEHPDAVPLCIGDTDHDAALADVLGADCLLYTGGHQSKKRLSACGKPLIDHISELEKYL